jgi:hypothetical protein
MHARACTAGGRHKVLDLVLYPCSLQFNSRGSEIAASLHELPSICAKQSSTSS